MEYPQWFEATGRANFERFLLPMAGRPNLTFLQIGAFTGDASVWMLDNVLTDPSSMLMDVDTWDGSDEADHKEFDWLDVHMTYLSSTNQYPNVRAYRRSSDGFFRAGYLTHLPPLDFVYIDGDHRAPSVLKDAINAFEYLKVGGIMAFDDYTWRSGRGAFYDPDAGVNAFTSIYKPFISTLEVGWQYWIRKDGTP